MLSDQAYQILCEYYNCTFIKQFHQALTWVLFANNSKIINIGLL